MILLMITTFLLEYNATLITYILYYYLNGTVERSCETLEMKKIKIDKLDSLSKRIFFNPLSDRLIIKSLLID